MSPVVVDVGRPHHAARPQDPPIGAGVDSARGIGDFNGDGFDDFIFGPHRPRIDIIYGVPTGDTCCNAHDLPGCTDEVVEACVCESNDGCCRTGWTTDCVALAAACGTCG